MDQESLFDERFLSNDAGHILDDPAAAIVELVANCRHVPSSSTFGAPGPTTA